MRRHLYLAAYDVTEPARLQRVLATVKRYATGGQKSVFECWLSAHERKELLAATKGELDLGEDRFFLLRLDPRLTPQLLGLALPPADPHLFYYG